jgi:hypothetical protein
MTLDLDRQARNRSSQEWKERLANVPKMSASDKKKRLSAILKEANGFQRVGNGMIGPIQIRLRYEGMVRNVLMEDTLERGPLMPYDVLDDLGMAYFINATESEVKIQVFEGKQITPSLFRIASFPRIRKEDLYFLRVNAVEYAQDESRQAIQKAEDARLILLLEGAIVDYGQAGLNPVGGAQVGISLGPQGLTPDRSKEKTVLIGSNSPMEPADFYSAVSMIEIEQLEASRLLMHPQDLRDLYTWDINVTGWAFKDKVVGGEKITTFGEFEIQKSVMIPQGEIFLLAAPEFVGVMPVMYSLDVEENHQVEQFYKGWVMDELLGMLVLNGRGLARVVKADTWAASNVITDLAGRGLYA